MPNDPSPISNQRTISTTEYPVLSPDGRFVAFIDSTKGNPCDVRIWDRESNKNLARLSCDRGVSFSANGKHFVVALPNGEFHRYSTTDWKLETKVNVDPKVWDRSSGLLASSPDGRQVVFRFNENCVVVWDLDANRLVTRFDGRPYDYLCLDFAKAVAYSPDGKMLAIVTGLSGRLEEKEVGEGELHVWEVASGKRLLKDQVLGGLHGVTFSPGGKQVAAGGTHGSAIWSIAEKKMVASLDQGKLNRINGITFSAKGDFLIIGTYTAITVWDTKTGEIHSTFKPTAVVSYFTWVSANTKVLLVLQAKATVLWDLNLE